jgi:hypothetical protein
MAFGSPLGNLLLLCSLDLLDIDLKSAAQLKNNGNGRVCNPFLDRFQQIHRISGIVREFLQA